METENFRNIGGIATVTQFREPDMRKRNNPYLNRVKVKKRFQVNTGLDLQALENRRAREENREPREIGPLPWGQYMEKGNELELPLIVHNGNIYLRGFFFKFLDEFFYLDGNEEAILDKKLIEEIKSFIPKKEKDKSQPLALKLENTIITFKGKTLEF